MAHSLRSAALPCLRRSAAIGSGDYMDTRKYWVQVRMFVVSCSYVFIYMTTAAPEVGGALGGG